MLGVALGLLAAEASVRVFRLEPQTLIPVMSAASPDEAVRLLCYPSDPHGDFPLDLRKPEVYRRYAGRPGFAELPKMARSTPFCLELGANRDQVRDREYAADKPEGCQRILCVGDSLTHGYGVPHDAPWPRQLERSLKQKYPDRCFEVMNYGRVGMDIPHVEKQIAAFAPAYHPDLVVYGYCLNDVVRGGEFDRTEQQVDSALVARLDRKPLGWPWEHLALARMTAERWYQRQVSQKTMRWYAGLYSPKKNPGGILKTSYLLRQCERNAADNGARFLLAVFPLMVDFGERYPFRAAHRTVVQMAAHNHIQAVDLVDAFRGLDPKTLWIHPLDHHPNQVALGVFARALMPTIENVLALDKKETDWR